MVYCLRYAIIKHTSFSLNFKPKFLDNRVRRSLSLSTELKLHIRDLEKVYPTLPHCNKIEKLNHECLSKIHSTRNITFHETNTIIVLLK